jgi:hypothetical protein
VSVAPSRTKEEVLSSGKVRLDRCLQDKTSFQFVDFHMNVFDLLKDMVGAPGFEPGASCAQGRRLELAKYRILNVANHFAQFTVVGIVVSDRLFSIACTIPAMRKASSFPVATFFCSSAG